MRNALHGRLMGSGLGGDLFDRHVFACLISGALAQRTEPVCHHLGLEPEELGLLWTRFFPLAPAEFFLERQLGADRGADALEEADLRGLIIEGSNVGSIEEVWLASMIARACRRPNHLWQDMYLKGRPDLSNLIARHFPSLARANGKNMKWKKFFYRELCRREGIRICKSPNCEICTDFSACFGPEDQAVPAGLLS